MNEKELELILQKGEDYKVEFKENVNSDLTKEFVAFANSSGGRVFIGINDKNKICGINSTNTLLSSIQDFAYNCDPPVTVDIESFENILIINVKEGVNKPYRSNKGFLFVTGLIHRK